MCGGGRESECGLGGQVWDRGQSVGKRTRCRVGARCVCVCGGWEWGGEGVGKRTMCRVGGKGCVCVCVCVCVCGGWGWGGKVGVRGQDVGSGWLQFLQQQYQQGKWPVSGKT